MITIAIIQSRTGQISMFGQCCIQVVSGGIMVWDIVQFLNDYFIPYIAQGAGSSSGWVNIRCPLPGCNDHSHHGGFNIASGAYNCWKCGPHPSFHVVQALMGCRDKEAKEIIWGYSSRRSCLTAINKESKKKVSRVDLPGGPLLSIHRQYLIARNFNPDKISDKYRILGTGPIPNGYRYRLVIPIIHKNIVVSFQARDVTDHDDLRYKGCPVDESIIHYKRLIYGLDKYAGDTVVLVEGVFDVWRLGDGFGCGFGTSLTQTQLKILSRFRQVIILFDPNEEQSWGLAAKYVKMLRSLGCKAERVRWDDERDPAELDPADVIWLRRELGIK